MILYDISPAISEGIGVFPGDVSYRRDISMDFDRGNHLALSSIHTTLHLGAHVDAPNHYDANGCGIGERGLTPYIGPCQVVQVKVERGHRIYPDDVKATIRCARVLFRTESFPDPNNWNSDFCSLSPELVHDLALKGCKLLGIDTPSIDPEDAKELRSHHAVAQRDMAILEGIVLNKVPEGVYTLWAIPLKLMHADASPVRAILLPYELMPEEPDFELI